MGRVLDVRWLMRVVLNLLFLGCNILGMVLEAIVGALAFIGDGMADVVSMDVDVSDVGDNVPWSFQPC